MDKKRTISFYINTLGASGGTQNMLSLLANILVKKHRIIIFTTTQVSSFYELDTDIEIIYFKKSLLSTNWFIRQEALKHKIDYFINLDVNTVVLQTLFLPSNTKLILWEHFSIVSNYKKWLFTLSRKYAVKRAAKFVVLSDFEAKKWKELYQLPESKTVRIYNPITVEENLIDKTDKYHFKTFLAIGNKIEVKGFDLLLEAWKSIKTDWNLKIVGLSEEEINKMQSLIIKNNLNNVAVYPKTKDIQQYYKTASAFVLSSRKEATPLVLIESQSYGIPIIAFDHLESVKEILNDSGIMADFSNPINSLIKKINAITLDKNLYNEYHLKSLENAKLFSLDSFKEKWMNVLK